MENKLYMEDSLFNDSSKKFTVRKDKRKYSKNIVVINKQTNKKFKALVTKQIVCLLKDLTLYEEINLNEYYNILKEFYNDITLESEITIVYYTKNKYCKKCNLFLELKEFYDNHSYCKECDIKYLKNKKNQEYN